MLSRPSSTFLLGSFATAFFLYGIALAFGATGSTSIDAIAAGLGGTTTPTLAITALTLIIIGLGFKVSAAPFHVWTPDVYQGAPAPVVGLMSTAPKAAAFAVLLRITYGAFGSMEARWTILLAILAALSMTLGNLGALLQTNVKRMLAYSSIANAGYLLVAFTAAPAHGITAAAFYTTTYAAMNVGAFAVITQVSGFDENTPHRGRLYRPGVAPPCPGRPALLLPPLHDRYTLHRRIHGQVQRLHGVDPQRPRLACCHRLAQQRCRRASTTFA